MAFTLDGPWRTDPRVAIRPERFGALLYHFGTRRLSFVKSPVLHGVLQQLEQAPTAREACRRAGVPDAELATYERALAGLAESRMIVPRDAA